jgi:hypothetical protein
MWYGYWMTNRWLLLRFDVLGAVGVLITTLFALSGYVDAGLAGVYYLGHGVHEWCVLDMSILDSIGIGLEVSKYVTSQAIADIILSVLSSVLWSTSIFLKNPLPLLNLVVLLHIGLHQLAQMQTH